MTALVQQVKPLDCSRKNRGCKNKADQRVTYKQVVQNEPVEVRDLCNSCFGMEDEKHIKIFQIGIAEITPLEELT